MSVAAFLGTTSFNALKQPVPHLSSLQDVTVAEMCEHAGLPREKCHARINQAQRAQRPHDDATWEQLYRIDPHFARAAMQLAHHYGYRDNLPRHIDGLDDDEVQS